LFSEHSEALAKQSSLNDQARIQVRQFNPRNIDVGPMQINYHWHEEHIPSLQAYISPAWNIDHGTRYLATLAAEYGIYEAVGLYHSKTSALAAAYREKVLHEYQRLVQRASR
jgi:hypothetical protein